MEEEVERFEMEIRNKDKGVFIDFSPRRIVLGARKSLKKAGVDDHLTVVMNGDRIDQAHRKIDGKEAWRHTGEALQAQFDSLLANATQSVSVAEFDGPNTYIVSVKRLKLLFSIATLPFSVFMNLFWRLFADVEVSEGENGMNGRIAFKESRIMHLIQSVQPPLSLLARVLQKIPPSAIVKPMKFVAKRLLINNQDVGLLKDDLLFVISEKRVGFLSPSRDGKLRFTSVEPLFTAYQRLSASVPVSLADVDDFGIGSEIRVKGTRTSPNASP